MMGVVEVRVGQNVDGFGVHVRWAVEYATEKAAGHFICGDGKGAAPDHTLTVAWPRDS